MSPGGLAIDHDPDLLKCYGANIRGVVVKQADLGKALSPLHAVPNEDEGHLRRLAGDVRIVLGGPPCQGHSDFNNRTRRDDPKNRLYLAMARAAELFEPEHVVVENVPGIVHDRDRVLQRTRGELEQLGYSTWAEVVDLSTFGVPQLRRRHVMIATKAEGVDLERALTRFRIPRTDLRWAIGDLQDSARNGDEMSTPSCPSPENRTRIDYLFDNDLCDLPDDRRPACHRSGGHKYKSVYGRLRWDQPAQTVTRGFYSTCMGRYVHPSRRRTLTAREAARLQFFPDAFTFTGLRTRSRLATAIGNAVPSKLGYVLALAVLDPGLRRCES
jgi:DNA (cytosine-5)-methyltransferase 1